MHIVDQDRDWYAVGRPLNEYLNRLKHPSTFQPGVAARPAAAAEPSKASPNRTGRQPVPLQRPAAQRLHDRGERQIPLRPPRGTLQRPKASRPGRLQSFRRQTRLTNAGLSGNRNNLQRAGRSCPIASARKANSATASNAVQMQRCPAAPTARAGRRPSSRREPRAMTRDATSQLPTRQTPQGHYGLDR